MIAAVVVVVAGIGKEGGGIGITVVGSK